MSRFAGNGFLVNVNTEKKQNSYYIDPNNTVSFDPEKMFGSEEEEEDWRF